MNQSPARTVAIVLDPDFGPRLSSLAQRVAVWVIDSSGNRPAIESLWSARRKEHAAYDVTVFRAIPGLSPEDHFAGVLRSVQKDEGIDDEAPALEWVEVYGLESSASIESLLRERGFGGSAPLAEGFRARMRREG